MSWLEIALWALAFAVTALGTWYGWQSWRNRKPDTTNTAIGSARVRQSGGQGKTHNHAQNSEDVDQSG